MKLIVCRECGEQKAHAARGMCAPCYAKWYRRHYPGRARAYLREWRRRHPHYMAEYMRAYHNMT